MQRDNVQISDHIPVYAVYWLIVSLVFVILRLTVYSHDSVDVLYNFSGVYAIFAAGGLWLAGFLEGWRLLLPIWKRRHPSRWTVFLALFTRPGPGLLSQVDPNDPMAPGLKKVEQRWKTFLIIGTFSTALVALFLTG